MSTATIVLLVLLVITLAALVGLYFYGKRMEKRQAENEAQLEAYAQQMTLLIIDKKMLRIKEAGLPPVVYENTPWYLKRSKLPIAKVKVGPRVMNLICQNDVYDYLPVKKEVKATVSGMYITKVRGIRGSLATPPAKKGWFAKLKAKAMGK